jgi:diguanylate cyclase (GGDEF)-like protein
VEGGIVLAERLLDTMRENPIVVDDHTTSAVTVSIGAASSDGTPLDEIMRRADEALYRAKRDGRDCLRLALP